MKVSLNGEYARNHLFVTVLMAGLGCWFAYDGLVKYPATPARELYASIEKSEPAASMTDAALEAFKSQKTKTQHGFAALAFLAAAVVGLRLLASARFRFEFDDDGFAVGGERHAYADVADVDDGEWEKKGITRLRLASGRRVALDAWHHQGVKEFHEALCAKTKFGGSNEQDRT